MCYRKEVSFSDINIPVDEIYSSMGFKNAAPDAETVKTTQELLVEVPKYLNLQYEFMILDGELTDNSCTLFSEKGDSQTFETGRVIAAQLRRSEQFVAFVATVGAGYFKWMDVVEARQDMVQTYISDCIGSQIVESVADYMEQHLQALLDVKELKRTNRFSPGYCGWLVKEQPKLFSLFPEERPCGIELTDSCLMLPVKSVSGIIGVGSDVRYLPYTCHLCDMKMCYKKKK